MPDNGLLPFQIELENVAKGLYTYRTTIRAVGSGRQTMCELNPDRVALYISLYSGAFVHILCRSNLARHFTSLLTARPYDSVSVADNSMLSMLQWDSYSTVACSYLFIEVFRTSKGA
jgi:hypothetical protein